MITNAAAHQALMKGTITQPFCQLQNHFCSSFPFFSSTFPKPLLPICLPLFPSFLIASLTFPSFLLTPCSVCALTVMCEWSVGCC